jgi:hypothetical protein
MRPPNKPITGADRDLIVEHIVVYLRPFKSGEAFAVKRTKDYIELLDQASKKPVRFRWPSESLKTYSKFRRSLTSLIAAFEQLPPSAVHSLLHFAQIQTAWEPGSPVWLLQQLKQLAAAAAGQTLGSSDGFSPDYSLTRRTAHHAYDLMCEASKAAITGGSKGNYRNIASLMFETISGKSLDSKRWCDAEIKRRRDHEEILQSLGLAGTDLSPR